MIKDLTVGKPLRVLIKFTIPLLISVLFQQFYNLADSIIVGRFVGEDAFAAVGASYPVTMLYMAVAFGANVGCSVIISQLFGQKRMTDVKTAVNTALIAVGALSVLLTIVGLTTTKPLLQLLKTPTLILGDAAVYLYIYIGGLISLFLYNIVTGFFTALGDSKTPLMFLIASSIGNVLLDILFVTAFDLGVAGVAWATFIAQGIAAILSLVVIMKRFKKIPTDQKPKLFSSELLKRLSLTAIPSILQQSFVSVGNILVQFLVNGFDSPGIIAGYSAATKVNMLVINAVYAISNGVSSFTAQNIGAGNYRRVTQGFRASAWIVGVLSIASFLLCFIFPSFLVRLFLEDVSASALKTGIAFLRIVSPFYIAVSIKIACDGILRGAAAMKLFMVATFTDLILRVVLSYVFAPIWGANGIWMSWPFGWMIGCAVSVVFYATGIWKPKALRLADRAERKALRNQPIAALAAHSSICDESLTTCDETSLANDAAEDVTTLSSTANETPDDLTVKKSPK